VPSLKALGQSSRSSSHNGALFVRAWKDLKAAANALATQPEGQRQRPASLAARAEPAWAAGNNAGVEAIGSAGQLEGLEERSVATAASSAVAAWAVPLADIPAHGPPIELQKAGEAHRRAAGQTAPRALGKLERAGRRQGPPGPQLTANRPQAQPGSLHPAGMARLRRPAPRPTRV